MTPHLDLALLLPALAVALALRPWRLLAGGALLAPMLGTLVLLPWLWALPSLRAMPLQLQLSGACLAVLMLGWPLAVPVLVAVGALAALLAGQGWQAAADMAAWLGVVPATLALALGAAIRRWIGPHLFVYVLGRAFLGTALCVFAAGALAQWAGHALPAVDSGLSLVARWLMAWGDAFTTGMLAAIFVAFRPHWLATWSDRLYLGR
ncbi:hypothetical protein ACT80S_00670 [Ramlibacter sp. MAHUQ-53]|uniref:hypothetical protein n=1 Tax=unclassified Ramlibacter TaxID=2617605 RepID=UPI003627D499